jgi:hypothetical protein
LKAKEKTRNHAALSEAELPAFLRELADYDGQLQTTLAMRLLCSRSYGPANCASRPGRSSSSTRRYGAFQPSA